jgi:hypothetical protein
LSTIVDRTCLLFFFFFKFRRQAPVKSAIAKMIKNFREMNIPRAVKEVNEGTPRKVASNVVKRVDKCIEMNGHHFQHLL